MWQLATSVIAKTFAWVVLVLVVGAGATGLGYAVGASLRTETPAAVANATLSILGAGSLTPQFPRLASLLANETPGISDPMAAQDYEGSLDIVNAFLDHGAKADVAAVADVRLIPQQLEPKYAGYEVAFGRSPEVLAYDPSLAAFGGISGANWGWKLVNAVRSSGVPFGAWNASTDPNGYNEIFSMELQGELYNSSPTAVLSHFYEGSPTSLLKLNPSTAIPEHESDAATLLADGTVAAVITYRSYAVANHLTFVSFNGTVGLNATGSAALADYAALSTTVLTSSEGTTTVEAAPVIFAVTVPYDAPNPALGAAFVHLLLSPQGSAILSAGGSFTPLFPGWIQETGSSPPPVPPVLAPDVVPMPGWAVALLS
jgi:molybdate/tungstate transport system substrate-binding protein